MITPAVASILHSDRERTNVYLFGLEAHVCILQTTLDLLRAGYRYVRRHCICTMTARHCTVLRNRLLD
jgi:nicotinamidase-related amidase